MPECKQQYKNKGFKQMITTNNYASKIAQIKANLKLDLEQKKLNRKFWGTEPVIKPETESDIAIAKIISQIEG